MRVLAGSGELAFARTDRKAVRALYQGKTNHNLVGAQKPVAMGFGYTFKEAMFGCYGEIIKAAFKAQEFMPGRQF